MTTRIRLFYLFGIISFLLTTAGLIGTFYLTPMEVKQIGFSQKIFYFHVPMAATSAIAFGVTLVASIAYLVTKKEKYDTWAVVGAELGLIFGSMLLVMGILWTRAAWSVWWTWDPRLTSYLVVMLLYSGYFVMRSSVDSPSQRARYSAALGIISYIAVIFTIISTRVLRSAHPVVFSLKDPGVEPAMLYTFLIAMHAMFLLFGALLLTRVSIVNMRDKVEEIKDLIGG